MAEHISVKSKQVLWDNFKELMFIIELKKTMYGSIYNSDQFLLVVFSRK